MILGVVSKEFFEKTDFKTDFYLKNQFCFSENLKCHNFTVFFFYNKHLGLLQRELSSQYLIVSTIPMRSIAKNRIIIMHRKMRLRGWSPNFRFNIFVALLLI